MRERRQENALSKRRQRHADSVSSGSGVLCVLRVCVCVACGEKASSSSSSSQQTAGHQLRFLQQPLYQAADRQSFVNGGEARETLQPLFVPSRPPRPPSFMEEIYLLSAAKLRRRKYGRAAVTVGGGGERRKGGLGGGGGGRSLRHKGGGAVRGRFMERLLSCSIYNACSFTSPLWQG